MKFNSFEEILAWQKAKQLSISIYNDFKDVRDYDFKSQIQRASVSVMNNIAEGFERGSNKDFIKFLYIAKGSCGEVRSMSYLAESLKYISQEKSLAINDLSTAISKMLSGLIKTL
jgi:four helix bundle protein